ncbi:MAG: FHA domain-containing protein [Coriobacteriia bacterium]|nr:FHA domain-containing protein [Coriobacteriia bacterium]
METCPSCGAQLPEGAEACPSCGLCIEGSTASFRPVGVEEERTGTIVVETSDIPVLVVHKGAETGERFYLEHGSYTVGRDPASDIFLNDVTVSRHHAKIDVIGGDVNVSDAGSLNGTYVNDVLVDSAHLQNGDALQIGRFKMIFLAGGGA